MYIQVKKNTNQPNIYLDNNDNVLNIARSLNFSRIFK